MKSNIRVYLFLLLLLTSCGTFGQSTEQLQVTVLRSESKSDSCCVYNVAIKNKSDTTVCILHSMFINLTSSLPQGLALYQQDEYKEYYSFHYSMRDTLYTFETLPYRAEGILPYQTLEFKVKVRRPLNKKYQQLSFEYLYAPDFCYSSFVKAMQQMTTWYLKFKRLKKTVDLPL
jgi:hypothetical protein